MFNIIFFMTSTYSDERLNSSFPSFFVSGFITAPTIFTVSISFTPHYKHKKVHYVDDPELAYVMQRYRECHDLYHCIFNLPVNFESELALKYFEFANLGLPMAGFAAAFAPLRLSSQKRARFFNEYAPWAIKCGTSAKSLITIYWEKRWEQSVEKVKEEYGIWDPPVVRWPKSAAERLQRESSNQPQAQ